MIQDRDLRIAAEEAAKALVAAAELTPEKQFLKKVNRQRLRAELMLVWVFAVWAVGTAWHPIPLIAAALALGQQAVECIRARRLQTWSIAVVAVIALACWASLSGGAVRQLLGLLFHGLALAFALGVCIRERRPVPWAVLLALLVLFSGWQNHDAENSHIPPELGESSPFGLQVQLEQVDERGMTVTLTRPAGAGSLFTDGQAEIVLYKDGKWNRLYSLDPGKKPLIPLPEDGSPYTLEVDWRSTYGTLEPGWYRVAVDVQRAVPGATFFQSSYFSVQFEIK